MIQTRFHPRAHSQIKVLLQAGAHETEAQVCDISMAGLTLAHAGPLKTDAVQVVLPIGNERHLVLDAEVKHQTDSRVGVAFRELDWEQLLELARFVSPKLA